MEIDELLSSVFLSATDSVCGLGKVASALSAHLQWYLYTSEGREKALVAGIPIHPPPTSLETGTGLLAQQQG